MVPDKAFFSVLFYRASFANKSLPRMCGLGLMIAPILITSPLSVTKNYFGKESSKQIEMDDDYDSDKDSSDEEESEDDKD